MEKDHLLEPAKKCRLDTWKVKIYKSFTIFQVVKKIMEIYNGFLVPPSCVYCIIHFSFGVVTKVCSLFFVKLANA